MNFARELSDILSGPPKMSQIQLAAKSGLLKSKVSRIVNGQSPVDKQTLDAVLKAFPRPTTRGRLVAAYIRDVVSASALKSVRVQARGQSDSLALSRLSAKGRKALKALLASEAHFQDFEKITINLAEALGCDVR
jgi:transcriptional regulator with XRE-family HTH domain